MAKRGGLGERPRHGTAARRSASEVDYFFRSLRFQQAAVAAGVLLGDRDQGRIHRSLDRAGLDARRDQPLDHAGHLLGLRRHVVAEVEVERAGLDEFAGAPALAAARGRDEHLAGEAGFLHRRRGADVHAVPEADDAAQIRILLQHGLRDRLGLGGIPVGGLARHHLDLGMLGEHVLDALERVGAGRRRQRALHDRDLVRLALAGLHHRLGVALADLDPVGADEGRAAIDRAHVDLDDVDAFVLGALHQLGVGLDVRIVHDDRRRLLRDQRGHRLRAGIGAPVRITHDHLHAVTARARS